MKELTNSQLGVIRKHRDKGKNLRESLIMFEDAEVYIIRCYDAESGKAEVYGAHFRKKDAHEALKVVQEDTRYNYYIIKLSIEEIEELDKNMKVDPRTELSLTSRDREDIYLSLELKLMT